MGDVNDDGYDDIAVSAGKGDNSRIHTYGLAVFTSKAGTSWENSSSGLPITGRYGGIDFGDLDGDGDLDLVAGGEGHAYSTVKGVVVWLNNGIVSGKLNWTAGVSPETTKYYECVIIDDVNGDGNGDILTATKSTGVRVWLGNGGAGGTLSWTAKNSGLPTSGEYVSLVTGDFNNDNKVDIVATDYIPSDPEVHLWTGDGSGSWTSQDSSLPTPARYIKTYGIDVGDFNKDGDLDLVYGTYTKGVVCLLGNGGGTGGSSFSWTSANTGLASTSHYYGIDVGDVDKDGDLDVLASSGFSGQGTRLYLGNGGAGGTQKWELATTNLPNRWFFGGVFGDFNNDTSLDIACSMWDDNTKGGVRAFASTVPGQSAPIAKGVWNGTSSNETSTNLGETAQLNGTLSSDAEEAPDGDITGTVLAYDWDLVKTPTGSALTDTNLSPDDKNATPSFVPDAEGNYTITLKVQDSTGVWSVNEMFLELEVIVPNDPPVADAGPDVEVHVGTVVRLNATGSYDPDGTIIAWQWNASEANPSEVFLQNATLPEASFLAPDVTGVYSFILKVRDDDLAWSEIDSVNITVTLPPNVPPVAITGADFAAKVDDEVILDASSSYDTDGQVVAWDWICESHPSLVLSGADTPEATFTPTEPGTYVFSLTVQDDRGDWSPEDSVTVTVVPKDVNVPPVAVIEGEAVLDIYLGESVVLDGTSSRDEDGKVEEYLWNCSSHPDSPYSGLDVPRLNFTPLALGDYVFTLAVRDDNGSWSIEMATVTIHVTEMPVNTPPVAVIAGQTNAGTDELVSLSGTSSYDPDGILTAWSWEITSHPGTEMLGADAVEMTFVPLEPGTFVITLRVMDNEDEWSPAQQWTVEVTAPDEPPIADAGADLTAVVGEVVDLDGSSSYDGEGSIEGWQWDCTSHQQISSLGNVNGMVATFSASAVGTYSFSLIVQDAAGQWSEPDEVIVIINAVNRPPVVTLLSPTASVVVLEDGMLTVEWSASDPDGDDLTITVEVRSGTEVLAQVADLTAARTSVTFNDAEFEFPRGVDLTVCVVAMEISPGQALQTEGESEAFQIEDIIVDNGSNDGKDGVLLLLLVIGAAIGLVAVASIVLKLRRKEPL